MDLRALTLQPVTVEPQEIGEWGSHCLAEMGLGQEAAPHAPWGTSHPDQPCTRPTREGPLATYHRVYPKVPSANEEGDEPLPDCAQLAHH